MNKLTKSLALNVKKKKKPKKVKINNRTTKWLKTCKCCTKRLQNVLLGKLFRKTQKEIKNKSKKRAQCWKPEEEEEKKKSGN